MRIGTLLVVVATGCAFLVASGAHARDVKRCGITIRAGKTGKLVKDVFCGYRCVSDRRVRCEEQPGPAFVCPVGEDPACEPETITLERFATLDLNGFNLASAFQQDGVVCSPGSRSRCTIKGPGTFRANRGKAITPNDRDIVLKDFRLYGDHGGFTTAGRIQARNMDIQRCGASMHAGGPVWAKLVGVDDGCGLSSAKDVTLNYVYIAGTVHADRTLRGRRVRSLGSSAEVSGRDVFLTRTSLTRVRANRRLVLRDSYIDEVIAADAPSLIRSTCMESSLLDGTASWGVCSLD